MATGGNGPTALRLETLASEWQLILVGTIFFSILILLATKTAFPNFFNKLTLGIYLEPSPETRLAKQVLDLKNDVELLRQGLSQSNASPSSGGNDQVGSPVLEQKEISSQSGSGDLASLLDNAIYAKIEHTGSEQSLSELVGLRRAFSEQKSRAEARSELNLMIDSLMDNAIRTRTRVFTLFAGVNMWLILLAGSAFLLKLEVTQSLLQAIFGLYVSMAVFLVYVYRNSSSRISVLLALKEDQNHHHDASSYLSRLRPNANLSDRDIEAMKLILTNHSEREKGNDHPYELVLKGITNSTVLLKGGKVLATKDKGK